MTEKPTCDKCGSHKTVVTRLGYRCRVCHHEGKNPPPTGGLRWDRGSAPSVDIGFGSRTLPVFEED